MPQTKVAARRDLQVVLQSFWKHWYLVALMILLSLLAAILEGFSVGLLIPFLQNLSETTGSDFQTGLAWFDHWILGVGDPRLERMYRICGVILTATWLRTVFGYFSELADREARARTLEDLRIRIVDQLQAVSLRFFSKTRAGEITNVFTTELERVYMALHACTLFVARGILLLVYTAFMVWVSWKLTLFAMAFFGLLSFGLTRLIARIRTSGEEISRRSGRMLSSFTELLNGIRTVVAFNMQEFERARLSEGIHQFKQAVMATEKRTLLVQPFSQAVVGTVLILTLLLTAQFYILTGELDIAVLLTFMFALLRLMPIVHQLNQERGRWAGLFGAVSNIAALLRRDDKPYLQDGTREVGHFREAIVWQHVTFSYEPGKPVLEDVNISLQRGKTTAIIGASGAGKTTLVDLIPRFYDPAKGRILLDGVDLRQFKIDSLRRKIAMVSQDTFIFNDTVRANIAYGAPGSDFEQIVEAADKANALEFIHHMEDGFDTMLGDRGVRLSGGQRQRIAIARALLRDPEILILDEATSALDTVTERLVQQSLERLMEGRTVIAIAHRLSTIENADWVIVLEDGRVAEEGTYAELLARRGQLWTYHALQYQVS